ncbi:MAG: hypothetical protein CSA22_00430 [Deltaproteobacteria bacterium]|nr:MAG: hypothetical protein CSA22_00430 [Deltaproteobacteria bacterium]
MLKTIEPTKLAKQILDFQKTAFDNTFNAIVSLQGQTEKITTKLMGQAPALPKEGRKVMEEWQAAFKKNQDQFKKSVEQGFDQMQLFFQDQTPAETAHAKTAK